MNERFRHFIEQLDVQFKRLKLMDPVKVSNLPRLMPTSGIYLFSERNHHLYVGRSNRLRTRIQEHSRPSSGHNSAPFAFLLTRYKLGLTKASYQFNGSRFELEKDPKFAEEFTKSKDRVRRMDIQYVEENDQMKQALLEMYVAIALHTKYNDFDTH